MEKQIPRFARDNNGVRMNDHSLLPTLKRIGGVVNGCRIQRREAKNDCRREAESSARMPGVTST